MFENGKPDIVLKMVKRFNIKTRKTFLIKKKIKNCELAAWSCLIKCCLIVFTIDF